MSQSRFSSKLLEACTSDCVQERLFSVFVKPALDKAFLDLGIGFGAKVGDMFATFQTDLTQLRQRVDKDDNQSDQSEAAPDCLVQEAAGSRSSKTVT